MNDDIVRTWNSTVACEDRVILVGDLSAGVMGRYEELYTLIGSLRGRKTLIRGNHDHQTDAWYKSAGFSEVHDWLIIDDKLFIHKPATSMSTDVISLVEQVGPQLIVHGHIHDDRPNIPGHFNVAWDRCKRLVNMSEIDTLGACSV
jgi:hypothetical protein